MKLGDAGMLNLLFLAPLMLLLYFWFNRSARNRLKNFADDGLLKKLVKEKKQLGQSWKFFIFITILVTLVTALARPQFGVEPVQVRRVGIDIVIALDTSLSMAAEDIAPNRLAKAKKEVERLANAFAGNRLGLLVFAGESAVECPLTMDLATFKLFLNATSLGSIPVGGTDISGAIGKATAALKGSSAKSKVIVLITDGEDHEGNALEQAKAAAKDGINIYTIGLGSETGVPIPIRSEGNRLEGYKKDRAGNMVLTKQDGAVLEQIAISTGGLFVASQTSADGIKPIIESIQKLEKSDITSTRFTSYVERFQIFLGIALALLLI